VPDIRNATADFGQFRLFQEAAFELSAFDRKLLRFGKLFRERFMDIRVSMPLVEALDTAWQTMAECFEPEELLMKQSLVDKYYPRQHVVETTGR
jgi:V/A-type H+-transporting ATPase subunit B